MNKNFVATIASALLFSILVLMCSIGICPIAGQGVPAEAKNQKAKQAEADEELDWQMEEQYALHYQEEGRLDEAEKAFLRAIEKLKRSFKNSPPSSFANRYFPLRDNLRAFYLNTAANAESRLPFARVDAYYKKALAMPASSEQMWQQYADFLHRQGKDKLADKALKDGKKKCLIWTNRG